MKSLTTMFADLTHIPGLLAFAITLVFTFWHSVRANAEAKIAQKHRQTFQMQCRLGVLSSELQALETCPSYGRGRRVQAVTQAYDRLLAEACERAGIDVEPQCKYQDVERLRRERALSQQGWIW